MCVRVVCAQERKRIALDIVLGHPAWNERSSASSPAIPSKVIAKPAQTHPLGVQENMWPLTARERMCCVD